jgi:chromate transporter
MIPLMQAECVNAGWVTEEQFLEGLAAGNALPGPIATKMAVYVGWNEAGVAGLFAAVIGVTLPSLILMAVFSSLLLRYRDHRLVVGALAGVKPAVIGMLAFVAWDLAPAGITGVGSAILAVVAFVALVMKLHPAVVMVGAMMIGGLLFRP